MAKLSKRMNLLSDKIDKLSAYSAVDAFTLLKKLSKVKFKESIDVAINLGIDPRKSDQVVRGSSVLPHGIGKKIRVAVFTQGENAIKAKEAGADIVGMEDLAAEIKRGIIDFDVLIATPDSMRVVAQLGSILGPKGLMPNPKVGTVSADIFQSVTNAKAGQVRFRADKSGIVHTTIGKSDFEVTALQQNLEILIADLKKLKPTTAKGSYIKKVTISSTMGPGIILDISSIGV